MIRTKYKVLKLEDIAVNSKNAIVDGPFGSALKVKDYVDDGIPVLQGKNISNFQFNFSDIRYITPQKAQELIRSKVEVGDILFVKIGSIGYSAEVTDLNGYPFAIIPANLAKVSIDYSKVDKNYLLFWLRSDTVVNYLKKNASKTAQPALSLGKIKQIPVVMPSLETQKKISAVLLKAQELIDKRKAQIEALDQLTQSVFLEMFGDPVSNPKGWDVKKLKDIAEIEDGDRGENYPKQHELVSEGILFLSTSNFVNNKLDLSKVTYITKEKFSQLRKGKLRRGDLIVTLRGSIGNIVIFDEEGYDTGFINAQMAILRLKNVNRIFFQQLYTSNSFQLVLKKTQTGSSQPQLPLKNLKELEIIIPPLELQELFAATIQQINLKKELLLKSQAEIQNMFNSLMQRAFKGELFND